VLSRLSPTLKNESHDESRRWCAPERAKFSVIGSHSPRLTDSEYCEFQRNCSRSGCGCSVAKTAPFVAQSAPIDSKPAARVSVSLGQRWHFSQIISHTDREGCPITPLILYSPWLFVYRFVLWHDSQMTAGATADALVLQVSLVSRCSVEQQQVLLQWCPHQLLWLSNDVRQRQFDSLLSQFAEEFSPERMAAVASLEKEVQYGQMSHWRESHGICCRWRLWMEKWMQCKLGWTAVTSESPSYFKWLLLFSSQCVLKLVVFRLVSATKARVARLETVVSNISLAKLIERVMQVGQPQVLPFSSFFS
jgi:hypothetical protein